MPLTLLTIILIIAVLVLLAVYYFARRDITRLKAAYEELQHNFLSKSVKHGQHWEQFAPFTQEFDKIASRENFTFIGQPIDGIAFDIDAIKFIEFKTGNSSLNNRQRMVKQLVKDRKIEWHELRF